MHTSSCWKAYTLGQQAITRHDVYFDEFKTFWFPLLSLQNTHFFIIILNNKKPAYKDENRF